MHQFFFPTNPFKRMIVEMTKKIFLIISCGVGYEISGLFIIFIMILKAS